MLIESLPWDSQHEQSVLADRPFPAVLQISCVLVRIPLPSKRTVSKHAVRLFLSQVVQSTSSFRRAEETQKNLSKGAASQAAYLKTRQEREAEKVGHRARGKAAAKKVADGQHRPKGERKRVLDAMLDPLFPS